jgi:hypothetical protein
MFTSENLHFAQRLADHRPPVIFSLSGEHNVEYMDSTDGPVAVIDTLLPEGMTVTLANGDTGTVKAVNIALPGDSLDEG